MTTILLSAGDQSGEMHGADLVRILARRLPDARFLGMGGAAMEAAGVEVLVHQSELAVGGLVEVASSLPRVRRALRELVEGALRTKPDLIVLIDSGGFNLLFARALRKRLSTLRQPAPPMLYYIAPQVWAWRPGRIQKLAERTDRIAVILPFEAEFYAARNIDVDFVGHPSVDAYARQYTAGAAAAARRTLRADLDVPQEAKLLGIFPGSRRNEWTRHLPIQLEAFAKLRERGVGGGKLHAVVGLAPSLSRSELAQAIAESAALDRGNARSALRLTGAGDTRVLDAVDAVLAKPGTITVEAMLRSLPMVVIAKGHPVSVWIARRSVRVKWLAMPNLVAGEAIVPELLQEEATADRIADELEPLFEGGSVRDTQIAALTRAKAQLGGAGATERVAKIVEELLETHHA